MTQLRGCKITRHCAGSKAFRGFYMRPDWNTYFMSIAEVVATRSTCLRRKVGAVIVKERRILATGYNGVPVNCEHCTESTCIRTLYNVPSGENHELCRGVHAEQNAIVQAASYGVAIRDSDIYVTTQPCVICAKMLINSGVKRIFCQETYTDPLALNILKEARIEVHLINGVQKTDA